MRGARSRFRRREGGIEVGLFLRVRSRHTWPLRSGRTFARICLSPFRLRKKDKRRLSIGAAVVFAVVGLLWFAVPQLVKGRVESAAEDRTGLSVSIDSLGLGFSGVTLSKIEVRSADGKAVQVDVEEA